MATAKEQQMKMQDKLAAIRKQIEELQIQERLLLELLGEEEPAKAPRQRSPNIKPMVLDYMREVAERGATSAEVDAHVRKAVPTVAKDTVGSILSRLKFDGALVYDGERYYEKRHAPPQRPLGIVRSMSVL